MNIVGKKINKVKPQKNIKQTKDKSDKINATYKYKHLHIRIFI